MNRIKLIGATASPYTQKMLALLRYRHIPYEIVWGSVGAACDELGIEAPKPELMPTFLFEHEGLTKAVVDSTPIIRRLEALSTSRSVIPVNAAVAFIDYLIEDFADEWCTKYMFHYRWHFEQDADNAGGLLPLGMDVSMPEEKWLKFKQMFSQRQIERLYVVGSNAETAATIDASYRRFLLAMEQHLAHQPFVLGTRPSAGDFALYGQLSQLIGFDPTPRAIAHEFSPRTVSWVNLMSDQSGLSMEQAKWFDLADQASSLGAILREIGRVYAPAQIANARAAQRGADEWQCDMDGVVWKQKTFAYQAKCLNWTNQLYQALSNVARDQVDALIEGTGVEAMLSMT